MQPHTAIRIPFPLSNRTEAIDTTSRKQNPQNETFIDGLCRPMPIGLYMLVFYPSPCPPSPLYALATRRI